MRLTHERLESLAAIHDDAFYIFDADRFLANIADFRNAFRGIYPRSDIAYSYKTNYTPAICRLVDEAGGYAEVVSAMECELAARVGVSSAQVIYNGPAKTAASIRGVLAGGGVVNLDSARDADLIMELLRHDSSLSGRVALRCNFDIGADRVSRFGMDTDGPEFQEVLARVRSMEALTLVGLHCHFQDRDLRLFERRTAGLLRLASRIFDDRPPEVLNVGGGFFGALPEALARTYPQGVPGFADYASVVAGQVAAQYPHPADQPLLLTEPGTALVADTFRFVTRVLGRKNVRGRDMLLVAGSMFNTSPYSRVNSLPVAVVAPERMARPPQTYDVCGYTCIEKDVLSASVELSSEVGDFLVYSNVGSYSIGMKPPFILPNVPVLMTRGDDCTVIKRSETFDDVFRTFACT
ncbi:hypothetical protein [Nocardioides sp. SYSU DS0651]|uniref:hypothetical protein n=1 Tax=Nocardioides sp. SYSU DS0651 TaxID=3415955 RepID=UPI003F4C2030